MANLHDVIVIDDSGTDSGSQAPTALSPPLSVGGPPPLDSFFSRSSALIISELTPPPDEAPGGTPEESLEAAPTPPPPLASLTTIDETEEGGDAHPAPHQHQPLATLGAMAQEDLLPLEESEVPLSGGREAEDPAALSFWRGKEEGIAAMTPEAELSSAALFGSGMPVLRPLRKVSPALASRLNLFSPRTRGALRGGGSARV